MAKWISWRLLNEHSIAKICVDTLKRRAVFFFFFCNFKTIENRINVRLLDVCSGPSELWLSARSWWLELDYGVVSFCERSTMLTTTTTTTRKSNRMCRRVLSSVRAALYGKVWTRKSRSKFRFSPCKTITKTGTTTFH